MNSDWYIFVIVILHIKVGNVHELADRGLLTKCSKLQTVSSFVISLRWLWCKVTCYTEELLQWQYSENTTRQTTNINHLTTTIVLH